LFPLILCIIKINIQNEEMFRIGGIIPRNFLLLQLQTKEE